MLHLLHAKINRCLLFSTIMLSSLNSLHGWQTISLSGFDKNLVEQAKTDDKVMKLPGSFLLEHAMHDYYRTYCLQKNCFIDLSLDPFFEYDIVQHASHEFISCDKRHFWSAGVFAQAQLQMWDVWFRIYDMIGVVKESCHRPDLDTVAGNASSSGADDVVMKLGYNFINNGDHRCAFYALGMIPTHRSLSADVARISGRISINENIKKQSGIESNFALTADSPAMGSKFFRIGGGFNGDFTLYSYNDSHLALLCDVQYAYAFKTTFINEQDWTRSTLRSFMTFWPYGHVNGWGIEDHSKLNVQFTPGHSIDGWFAVHYKWGKMGFELGSVISTMFGRKAEFNFDNEAFAKVAPRFKWLLPEVINVGVQPYISSSYNLQTSIGDFNVGLGAGYEYMHTTRKNLPKAFQGLNVWGNASLTF